MQEKGRAEITHQDWCALQCFSHSRAHRLCAPHCKSMHCPAPAHLGAEAAQAVVEFLDTDKYPLKEGDDTTSLSPSATGNLRLLKGERQSIRSPLHQLSSDLQLSEEDNL